MTLRAEHSPRPVGHERHHPRRGARRTVLGTIRQLPHYLRLLYGLLTDSRVSRVDKVLVFGAIAYILAPIDLIPDFVPFLGQVDDVFLLLTALRRLISNAGRLIVVQHWMGDPEELADLSIERATVAAAFFLPPAIRRRIRRLVGRGRA